MRAVRRVLFLLVITTPAASAAEPAWRALLPEGWLGVVAVANPEATDAKIGRLLGDLSFEYAGGIAALKAAVGGPRLRLGGQTLVVGAAASVGGGDSPYWFALAPLADFDAWVAAVSGERLGEIGVASVAGVDVALAPCGEWAFITPLDQIEVAKRAMRRSRGATPANRKAGLVAADIIVEVSAAGVDYLANRAASADEHSRGRTLQAGLSWPPTRRQLDAALLQNAPLLEHWRKELRGLRLDADLPGDGGGITLRVASELKTPPAPSPAAAAAQLPPFTPENPAMLVAEGVLTGPLTFQVLDLTAAYSRGRPDQVGAAAYPEALFQRVTEAQREAARGVTGFRIAWLDRSATEGPIAACEASLMATADQQKTRADLRRVFDRSNELIEAMGAPMPVVFTAETVTRAGREMDEYRVDMVKAVGVPDSVEVRALMERLYGEGGEYVRRIIPIGDRVLLETDTPLDEALTLAEQVERAEPAAVARQWRATARIDRFLAWQAAMRRASGGKVWGGQAERPMNDAATVTLVVGAESGSLRAEANADRSAVRAIGQYLQANR